MSEYAYWETHATRWNDNDSYGHLNNTVHWMIVDTTINDWLIAEAGLDLHGGTPIGLAVESRCSFKAEASYPDRVRAGLRIGHLGNSSVRYEVGLFRESDGVLLAEASFTHVFVDRETRRPVRIEGQMRKAMEGLLVT